MDGVGGALPVSPGAGQQAGAGGASGSDDAAQQQALFEQILLGGMVTSGSIVVGQVQAIIADARQGIVEE